MATLLEQWRTLAYGDGLDDKKREDLWKNYFAIEKGIYEKILSNPTEVVEGTVKELAEKYGTDLESIKRYLPASEVKEQVIREKVIKVVADSAVAVEPEEKAEEKTEDKAEEKKEDKE